MSDGDFETIARANILLPVTSDNVVDQIVWAHGSRTGQAGLAPALNLASRQRMLTRKMAKEMALIGLGRDPEGNRRSLGETALLFDQSLTARIDGVEALQISPAPDHVRLKLLEVSRIWSEYGQIVQAATDDAPVDPLALLGIAAQADPLLVTMNDAVTLYQNLA